MKSLQYLQHSEVSKIIRDSHASFKEAESKLKFTELLKALSNAKSEMSDAQRELLEKDQKISDLQKKLDIKANIIWERPYYWIQERKELDGPYCQHCYDTSEKLIRLRCSRTRGLWFCSLCKNSFEDGDYKDPYDQLWGMGIR